MVIFALTNYNKNEQKIVGGKNGFGFKLVLIWSEWGTIETVDHIRGKKYKQTFKDNLNIIEKPKITSCKTKPYTEVVFKPDYKRLGINGLSSDMLALFKRRVYDISAVTDKKIKVKYNGEAISANNFQQYVDLYIGSAGETKRVYESANERWEYAVCMAPSEEFTQVSFVNGIYTGKGGKHVDYLLNQLVRKLTAYIKKKKKIDVKSSTIKEQLMLFVRCDINNPCFDSQTKDYMNTPSSTFGSSCEISEKFIDKVKDGRWQNACALTEVKEIRLLRNRWIQNQEHSRIPKLTTQTTWNSEKRPMYDYFCEGIGQGGYRLGLSTEDRNTIGVYPMRGKLFNVRGETQKRILDNKEITKSSRFSVLKRVRVYSETVKSRLLW